MKKLFLSIFFLFVTLNLFSQMLPEKLCGIWEAKDRYVFFEKNAADEPELVVVLKTYYGWYLDRAAEPEAYAEKEVRTRNVATPRNAEHIQLQNIETKETSDSLYGSLDLYFSRWQANTIPFLIIADSMYLSYFEKDEVNQSFYRGIAPSKGFLISPQNLPKDITGYIIDGEKLYDVRYWQTNMDYSTDYITFQYQDDSYTIPKHLRSCETNYSCVSGRSKKVRNTVKSFEYKAEDYLFNDNQKVFTKNEEPYLKRLADCSTFEDLMVLVKESNSRRKPDPSALFPESNLDWHWDLIDLLEKNNEIIQQVRARQKAFGPRGRDVSK